MSISDDAKGKERGKLARAFWVTSGTIALALGIIGIVIPGFPTVPFILLAAACYCRGSKKMYNWLLNHKWFGGYIKDWEEHRGVRRRAKIISIFMLWLMIGISALVFIKQPHLQILLFAIAVCVTIFLLSLKTV
ncbi:MAG: YbaN family protein [Thermoplasmata archaeon]|nr:YbaN family protein [Thermoplasmata archaeon]